MTKGMCLSAKANWQRLWWCAPARIFLWWYQSSWGSGVTFDVSRANNQLEKLPPLQGACQIGPCLRAKHGHLRGLLLASLLGLFSPLCKQGEKHPAGILGLVSHFFFLTLKLVLPMVRPHASSNSGFFRGVYFKALVKLSSFTSLSCPSKLSSWYICVRCYAEKKLVHSGVHKRFIMLIKIRDVNSHWF